MSTHTSPATSFTADAGATLRRLGRDYREVPVRFLVLAGLGSAAVLWGAAATPVEQYFNAFEDEVEAFLAAMWRLGHLLLVVAPVLALRWPLGATVVALLSAPVALFGQHAWPFVGFVSLLVVAMVSVWRSPRRALVPAVAALLWIATLVTGATVMVMPYGAEIGFAYGGGDAGVELDTLAMYTGVVLVALAVAWWMRSSALTARRAAALEARSAEVEGEATVLGERARLARDLHDVVAHHVSLIAVRAETAPYTHPDLPPEATAVLADIASDARGALDELRGVLGILRRAEDGAAELAPQPTLGDVATLVTAATAAGEEVTLSGDLGARVDSAQGYVAYRVVQEALTNARRHAPGQPVALAVVADGPRLLVRVTNPYLAASTSADGAGRGLTGMRERVEAVGGRLDAGVRDDLFVVEADLPRGEL
jgi:signal transduction histidine kinase